MPGSNKPIDERMAGHQRWYLITRKKRRTKTTKQPKEALSGLDESLTDVVLEVMSMAVSEKFKKQILKGLLA